MRVSSLAAIAVVVGGVIAGPDAGAPRAAQAGPAARFGVTFALADEGAPMQHQFGPMLAVGIPLGPLVAEVDYALLSFMEPDTVTDAMHRVGVTLRADLLRRRQGCTVRIGCTRELGLYAQAGAAMRYGQWALDAATRAPEASDRQREAHVGLGLELVNRLRPSRLGWQLGLRLAMAPRDDLRVACRGACRTTTTPPPPPATGELDLALLVEWVFIVGR